MATKTDVRQFISRDTLTQIANQANMELDDLLRLIDSELTAPLRLNATTSPSLTVNVENVVVTNSQTNRRRTIQPINDQVPTFSSGNIVFPAISGGTAVVSPGTDVVVTLPSGQFLKALISLDDANNLVLDLGDPAASEAAALLPAGTGSRAIGYVVLKNIAGTIQNISNSDIVMFVGGGSGGGGVVQWRVAETTGVTGTTITFTKNYSYNKNAFFFRNGVEMRKVAAFTVGVGNYSDEYMEVNAGNSSNQITLHPSFPAIADDIFEMRFLVNTFDGVGLAEKTIQVARGYADGTQAQNCSISTVSLKTRVTLSTGFSFIQDYNSGKTRGDIVVRVNGQDIERKVTGVNDNVGNVVFEEASGTQVDIYEIIAGPSTQPLPADAQIEVEKVSYFVAELDAITSSLIPLTDNTYDLGAPALRWKDAYLGPSTIHIGTSASLEGQIRWDTTTQKLQFRHLPTDSWSDLGTGGGGAADGGDILGALDNAELNALASKVPNQILDSFDTNLLGTKVNLSASADALRFNAGQNNGTYTRRLLGSAPVTKVTGVAVHTAQALAPKDGQTVPMNGASQNIKFGGDVTELFPTTKKILLAKFLQDSDPYADGANRYGFLPDADGNIAELVVSAVSYNIGLDETTITVTNLGTPVDLAQGVTTNNLHSQMRVIPWDYKYEAKSLSSEALEQMKISDASLSDVIRLQGESPQKLVTGGDVDGSLPGFWTAFSENKQYGVAWGYQSESGNDQISVYYTVDAGNSWTFLGHKTTAGSYPPSSVFLNLELSNPTQAFVANNGKMALMYNRNGTNREVWAVYANLSSSPVLTDFPDISGGAGRMFFDGGQHYDALTIGGDKVDGSLVHMWSVNSGGPQNLGRVWTWTGATPVHIGSTSAISTISNQPASVHVLGTSPSRRTWFVYTSASNNLNGLYFAEASTSFTTFALDSGGNIANHGGIAFDETGTGIMYVSYRSTSGDWYMRYFNNVVSGSPALVSGFTVMNSASGMLTPVDGGVGATAQRDFMQKTINRRVIIDPSNNKHVFFVDEIQHPDSGARRSGFIEVKNTDSMVGTQISQYSTDNNYNLRHNSGATKQAQTFTGSATRVRTVALRLFQNGVIPPGYEISVKIEATTGGNPNGTVLASSVNTYDPSRITKSTSGQWCFFNFDDSDVESLTGVYAIVLEGTFPISASNYISFKGNTGGYAGGNVTSYDGSSWSASATLDFVFEISGEWITDLGLGREQNTSSGTDSNLQEGVCESSIALISNNQINFLFRKTYDSVNSLRYGISGHPFRRVITINSGAISTKGDATVVGFQDGDFDPRLVFNVSLGNDDSRAFTADGAVIANQKFWDRSGLALNVAASPNIVDADFVADSSFQSGFACDFDGSSEAIQYSDNSAFDLYYYKPFCIEIETKPTALASTMFPIAHWTGAHGWKLRIGTDGSVEFEIIDSGSVLRGGARSATGVITAGVYKIIRVVGLGTGLAPKIYTATAYDGTFTEVPSYSSQTSFTTGQTSATTSLTIGANGDLTAYFNGKIGYAKFANGASSFAYTGWKNQAPLINCVNHGSIMSANKVIGQSNGDGSYDTPFYQGVVMNPDASEASMVDSYDVVAQFNHELAGDPGRELELKVTAGRGSERNQSSIQGINFRFTK